MFLEDEVTTVKSFSYSTQAVKCYATIINRSGVYEVLTQFDDSKPVIVYFGTCESSALENFDNFVKVAISS